MNVDLQTCDSCFKSETLSCGTKIHMLCFLGFYRTPTDSTKENDKRTGRRKRGGGGQDCARAFEVVFPFFFWGVLKHIERAAIRELRPEAEARLLPPNTPRHQHAVHDLRHNK